MRLLVSSTNAWLFETGKQMEEGREGRVLEVGSGVNRSRAG